jgi:hypothetical protein
LALANYQTIRDEKRERLAQRAGTDAVNILEMFNP